MFCQHANTNNSNSDLKNFLQFVELFDCPSYYEKIRFSEPTSNSSTSTLVAMSQIAKVVKNKSRLTWFDCVSVAHIRVRVRGNDKNDGIIGSIIHIVGRVGFKLLGTGSAWPRVIIIEAVLLLVTIRVCWFSTRWFWNLIKR